MDSFFQGLHAGHRGNSQVNPGDADPGTRSSILGEWKGTLDRFYTTPIPRSTIPFTLAFAACQSASDSGPPFSVSIWWLKSA